MNHEIYKTLKMESRGENSVPYYYDTRRKQEKFHYFLLCVDLGEKIKYTTDGQMVPASSCYWLCLDWFCTKSMECHSENMAI